MSIEHGIILSVPKEPGSNETILRSVSPEEVLNPDLMAELRGMVKDGAIVPDLVRCVQKHFDLAEDESFTPILYLTYTFLIGLKYAKEIALGHQFLAGTFSDSEINSMIMPHILAKRQQWDPALLADAEQPAI